MSVDAAPFVSLAHRPMGHLPVLDGLRGVAIAMVFAVHASAPVFPGGDSGVILFFVLSGFLITKLALEEADRTGRLSLSQFYIRRVFRILPPLLAMLLFLLFASWTLLSDVGDGLRREIVLAGGSVSNIWPLLYGNEPRVALGHTWSLGVEEQFYFVWPIVLSLVPLAFSATRRFAGRVAVVTLLIVFFGRVVVAGLLDYQHWLSIPFLNSEGLALGCLLAALLHTDDAASVRISRWVTHAAVLLVAFDLFASDWYFSRDTFNIRGLVISWCFTLIVADLVTNPGSGLASSLSTSPMRWLGRISYSLFLWHATIFSILSEDRYPEVPRLVLVVSKISLSFVVAVLSYRYIERPAIAYGRRLRARKLAFRASQP